MRSAPHAVILADLETTPLGTRSRLADEINGEPILRATVQRVLQAQHLAGCTLLVPQKQADRCARLLGELPVKMQRTNVDPPPWGALVRVGRKWSLKGWRGGIGGTTALEEYIHPAAIAAWIEQTHIERVMVFPPAAPLLVPELIDAMIAHHDGAVDDARMTFAQAPPGAVGAVYNADLIDELARKNIPPGWVLNYKPDAPRKDLVFFSCCHEVRAPLRYAASRLIADTDDAERTVRALLEGGPAHSAEALGRRIIEHEARALDDLPRETEIELTTDDPFPEAVLRPRGARVGRRGPLPMDLLERLARSLGSRDDSLVVLGGYGEPLRHPLFDAVLATLRRCGVYGINVRTSGIDLDEPRMDSILRHEVDVLTVLIDGWTPGTYAAMHAPSGLPDGVFERLLAGIDRLEQMKVERKRVAPVIIPEMVKARPTVAELPAFFDGWIRRLGTANVVGYSRHSGQSADLSVINMAPPVRTPCRRIRSRCLVRADGSMTVCDQDFRGVHPVGDLRDASLESLWRGPTMQALREAHLGGEWSAMPLCANCEEWHRP